MAEQRGKRRPKRPATAPSDGLDDGELPPLLRAVPSLPQLPVEMLPEALPPPAVRVELEEIDHEDEAAPADDRRTHCTACTLYRAHTRDNPSEHTAPFPFSYQT